MGKQTIEYQKVMTEIIWVSLPGPEEPDPGMSGGELLHGFLAELHQAPSDEIRAFVSDLSNKWGIRYRETTYTTPNAVKTAKGGLKM